MLQYLYLKPIGWSQSIRSYSNKDPSKATEGTLLSMNVRAVPDTELSLNDESKLKDYDISLSVIPGDLPPDELQKRILSPDALGGLWHVKEENFVHGWFFFKRHNYEAVWDQVKTGGYRDCTVTLGVMPDEDDVWRTDNPLSIVSADIRFDRLPPMGKPTEPQKAPRKGWFG